MENLKGILYLRFSFSYFFAPSQIRLNNKKTMEAFSPYSLCNHSNSNWFEINWNFNFCWEQQNFLMNLWKANLDFFFEIKHSKF
jgi:hypothetical protein